MQKRTKNRLLAVLLLMIFVSCGVYIILANLKDNIVFFYPPSEMEKIENSKGKIRVGGLVKTGSIKKISAGKILFTITDNINDLDISYEGALPSLFREQQGIVAEGHFLHNSKIFIAKKLLAKHDENYMPPTVKKNLEKK